MAWRLVGAKHNLNQFRNTINSTLRDKPQLKVNQDSYIFIQENEVENVV